MKIGQMKGRKLWVSILWPRMRVLWRLDSESFVIVFEDLKSKVCLDDIVSDVLVYNC